MLDLGYRNPSYLVPIRYLIIFLTIERWDSLGFAWYLAHKQTLNIMSNLLVVRYNKLLIMPQCNVISTIFPLGSELNLKCQMV